MKKFSLLLCLLSLSIPLELFGQLQSPQEYFHGNYSKKFTGHAAILAYIQHLSANSDKIKWVPYGQTNEGRTLGICMISSAENLSKAEEIRKNHLAASGVSKDQSSAKDEKCIIWLSHGVHGNEAGATESSIQTMYDLVNPNNVNTREWLKNTIVLLDPSVNPDGYDRYCNWNNSVSNLQLQIDPQSREHQEPWPGGRPNHYYFDLNRDWAWQSQIETQQRLVMYNKWLPVIHVDAHEMYKDNSYYFAPAAEPYHAYITPWQREFQEKVGRNNAKYFDAHRWLYYTGEYFDLLYPAYGDTYPTFRGAIGMTYEQAGHGAAGRAIITDNGDTLTLADRIDHHNTAILSTVEMASKNAVQLNDEFAKYIRQSIQKPIGKFKTYWIKGDWNSDRMLALRNLLDRNSIVYGQGKSNMEVNASYSYATATTAKGKLDSSDLVIPASQAFSTLLQVLFEPEAALKDSLTYDITAWAIPYAYGLEVYASTETLEFRSPKVAVRKSKTTPAPYAICIPWTDLGAAKAVSKLEQAGLVIRVSTKPLTIEGKMYQPGSLMLLAADHRKNADWDKIAYAILNALPVDFFPLSSGWLAQGNNLGSDTYRLLKTSKVALVSGPSTNENSMGHVWHFMEAELGFPLSILDAEDLSRLRLSDYNTLIFPDGSYDLKTDFLETWVKGGGKLILMGAANQMVAGKPNFHLINKEADKKSDSLKVAVAPIHYSDRERSELSNAIFGAAIEVDVDLSHPLGYGLNAKTYFLKTSGRVYKYDDGLTMVGTIGKNPRISGFVGAKKKITLKESLFFAVESMGAGQVVYLSDEPLFRSMWYDGKLLMANAIFMSLR
ncbi:MAG: M14 family zinc carboxypeptidase [Saprospiraceae bacterium]